MVDDLLNEAPNITLPPELALRMALVRGRSARVSGAIYGNVISTLNARPLFGYNTYAQIYFPPLAWQLVWRDGMSLLDREGWADVTDWGLVSPSEDRTLSEICPPLPVTAFPGHHPSYSNRWMELSSKEICDVAEAHEISTLPTF
jgi:hypothetical protein